MEDDFSGMESDEEMEDEEDIEESPVKPKKAVASGNAAGKVSVSYQILAHIFVERFIGTIFTWTLGTAIRILIARVLTHTWLDKEMVCTNRSGIRLMLFPPSPEKEARGSRCVSCVNQCF